MKVDTALCNIPQTLLTRITIKLTNYDVRSWSKFDGKLINIHASLEIFVHMAYFAMIELSYWYMTLNKPFKWSGSVWNISCFTVILQKPINSMDQYFTSYWTGASEWMYLHPKSPRQ